MDANEVIRELRAAGHVCPEDPSYMNTEGRLILLIDGVTMFQRDAGDLLKGRATIKEIIDRNKKKNLGWTHATKPRRPMC